ncbi:MAG: PhnA domain-containing protein [Planctomycetaceae bacterium]
MGAHGGRRCQSRMERCSELHNRVTRRKVGTKVRNIRLVDGDHDIDCRIDGLGAISLKSQFVRKA